MGCCVAAKLVHRLQLEQYAAFHNDVRTIRRDYLQAPVVNGNRHLRLGSELVQLELAEQTTAICALQQAGA